MTLNNDLTFNKLIYTKAQVVFGKQNLLSLRGMFFMTKQSFE